MEKSNFLNKTQSDEKHDLSTGSFSHSKEGSRIWNSESKSYRNWSQIPPTIKKFSESNFVKSYKNVNTHIEKYEWSQSEDLLLVSSGDSLKDELDWRRKATSLPIRSPEDRRRRWKWLHEQYSNKTSWTFEEQLSIYRLLDRHGFTWKSISQSIHLRTPNAIKGLVHASLRKILKTKSVFWCLYKFARWPTFTNKSKPEIAEVTLQNKSKNSSRILDPN